MTGSLVQAIDYAAIAPPLLVAVTALAALLGDLLLPAHRRHVLGWVSLAGLLAGLLALLPLRGGPRGTFCVQVTGASPTCSYVVSDITLVFQLLVLAGAAVVVLLSLDTVRRSALPAGEYYFLLLCSVTGALTLAAARDILIVVVALEVVSLPAFALVGLRRYDGRSSEAALKFFLVSVVSTAVMLFGVSLLYGVTGAVHLDRISAALADPALRQPVTVAAVVLTIVGFGFKVSAVPFHFWAPDTYVGAPVPVAAYLSVVSKAAGFVGLVLVVTQGFGPYADVWSPVVAALAALSMTVGNLVALRQRHAVRLLAWSSVAQAGYMLVPLGAAGAAVAGVSAGGSGAGTTAQVSATVAYVAAYAVMNLGAFSVVAFVGRSRPGNYLADYRGLVHERPVAALSLAFFLACLAGLPPGLLGLFAKIVVFVEPVRAGTGWLAVVMAVNTVVALYYYLTWAATLFARAPEDAGSAQAQPDVRAASWPDQLAIGVTLAAAVVLSVTPAVVVDALGPAATLLG